MNNTPSSTPEALATPDRCPRCAGSFLCSAALGQCDCFALRLSDALKAELAQRYTGCLCMGCLRELAAIEAAG